MNIAFYEVEPWEQKFFEQELTGHTLFFSPDPLTKETVRPETEILSPFIYSSLTSELLSSLPRLKLIATRSTGTDHIDVKYAQEHDIQVKNVPAYGIDTIAEHTFALILALTRKIPASVEQTRTGNFSLDGLRGSQIAGKTIGIVGFGSIGIRVAELAHTFHMKIFVSSRHEKPEFKETLGIQFVDLPTLLSSSDIVTLHVPADAHTHHLINKENILTMKQGSILINTARGSIVETEAILLALEKGMFSGVGLDVLEEEHALKEERELVSKRYWETYDLKTQLFNRVLLSNKNVIITPHNAFNSQEALQEITSQTVKNIREFNS